MNPGDLYAQSLRTKHLERAHRNLDKVDANTTGAGVYAAALMAAADAYQAGYLAANSEATNPFIDVEEPS
jgi:hypothetical protein